jgi:dsDNA-binding SOS-regulon protein
MQWDGAYHHQPKEPAFFNKEDAEEFLGDNKYDYFDKKTIRIYESILDYEDNNHEKIRQRALSKLTEKEKKALGLI